MDKTLLNESLISRIEEAQLFTKRFASFNKSDYEILMFTVYLDCLEEDEINDYTISIELGIPESKVRSLRLKSQLQYPREIQWEEKLAAAISHGTYDKVQKQVTITIEDPSVRNRIRYVVESKYGTVNLSLNNKQLVLPVESFLILASCAEYDADSIIHKLNKELQKSKVEVIEKGSFKARFLKSVSDPISILANVATIYSVGRPIIDELIKLISVS